MQIIINRHFPNLLQCPRNNGSRRGIIFLDSKPLFAPIEKNSESVYCGTSVLFLEFISILCTLISKFSTLRASSRATPVAFSFFFSEEAPRVRGESSRQLYNRSNLISCLKHEYVHRLFLIVSKVIDNQYFLQINNSQFVKYRILQLKNFIE